MRGAGRHKRVSVVLEAGGTDGWTDGWMHGWMEEVGVAEGGGGGQIKEGSVQQNLEIKTKNQKDEG